MMVRLAMALVLISLSAVSNAAQPNPSDFAWQMAPGAQLPLDTVLRDEAGQAFPLRAAFAGRPVILDLGYFHCPSLCGLVRADLINALQASGLVAGRDYAVVALSIDPSEAPGDAASAKAADLAQAPFATRLDWHYLTGAKPAISAIGSTAGFRARYDAAEKQFLHPAGLVVLSRTGVVSDYLLGLGYSGGDVRAAVLRAGEGGIVRSSLPVLLLCFHFDAATGRYTLAIEKVLRLMAALTVLTLAGLLVVLHRQGPAR